MNHINSNPSFRFGNSIALYISPLPTTSGLPYHKSSLKASCMFKQAAVMMVLTVCLYLAAQLCSWAVMNVVVIYFVLLPLAGCEHPLIPVRASFSGPLIAQSSGYLIRSMKWGSRLLGQRFNISRKIRSILINYPPHWIAHICLRWRRGCFAIGGTSCFNIGIRGWRSVTHEDLGGLAGGCPHQNQGGQNFLPA